MPKPSVQFVAIPLTALTLWLTVHPARAAYYFVVLADGCHDANDLPAQWRSPEALQQWLKTRDEQVKSDEAHLSDGSLHHILIRTSGGNSVAAFFQRLPICQSWHTFDPPSEQQLDLPPEQWLAPH